tara:strand:+ start:1605 stop:2057 length:453 start_codon:yes stop_codon:yes gene_type:complete
MEYSYNKTYTFEVNASFGDLPKETIDVMFRDGRVASKFLEHHLPVWFPELDFVDAKGYDHVNIQTGRKLDAKCFTKGGLTFAPSVMLGAGRRIIEQEVHDHAETIDYIACDVVEFPKVRIRFVTGTDLVKNYPGKYCKVPFSQREKFFTD